MVGAIGRLCDRGFRAWRKLRAVTICFPKRKWFLTCEKRASTCADAPKVDTYFVLIAAPRQIRAPFPNAAATDVLSAGSDNIITGDDANDVFLAEF